MDVIHHGPPPVDLPLPRIFPGLSTRQLRCWQNKFFNVINIDAGSLVQQDGIRIGKICGNGFIYLKAGKSSRLVSGKAALRNMFLLQMSCGLYVNILESECLILYNINLTCYHSGQSYYFYYVV